MEDYPSWFVVVFGVVVVIACSYLFCYYFPLIEPTNLEMPVKSPISVSRISSPNFRRMTFVPAIIQVNSLGSSPSSSCPTDIYAADESCSEACSVVYSPDALLLEKVGPEVYVSLKTYEKAFEDLDELNLMVQYLVREGRCTKEHIKEHLKLYEEKVNDTINMNTKLRDVILRGLREKKEYELCEQVHKEFLRINWKF